MNRETIMFVSCNRIPVHPDHAAAFEARFAERAGQVEGMAGFLAFQLLRPLQPGAPYVAMTFWESEAHFRAWTESPAFAAGHARSGSLPPETYTGRPALELFEVIQAAGSVPAAAE
jgi:heme-degrading monooxygenase HmoA